MTTYTDLDRLLKDDANYGTDGKPTLKQRGDKGYWSAADRGRDGRERLGASKNRGEAAHWIEAMAEGRPDDLTPANDLRSGSGISGPAEHHQRPSKEGGMAAKRDRLATTV
jgi:hypothetical protein